MGNPTCLSSYSACTEEMNRRDPRESRQKASEGLRRVQVEVQGGLRKMWWLMEIREEGKAVLSMMPRE